MTEAPINPSAKKATSRGRRSRTWWAMIVLTIVTLLAYSNAAHESLVLDDKAFVGPGTKLGLQKPTDAFLVDIWEKSVVSSGLYRPLLMISFHFENRLFEQWPVGFHLVNILLHLVACLLLFGFLRHLLSKRGYAEKTSALAALLAAVIFAVHPVHTEVVNSVFNRSSIYVSIFAIIGLWWLFSRLDTRPVMAWLGLGAIYSLAILFKESALVIPGIAAMMVILMTPGNLLERMRRFLPVFYLLLPIIVFFFIRSIALAPGQAEVESAGGAGALAQLSWLPDRETWLKVMGNMGRGLWVTLWPYPLRLYYSVHATDLLILLAVFQGILAALAVYLLVKGRPALAVGLAFFYLAMLPASRLISLDSIPPNLQERYLYFPSVGLAITLSFALAYLIQRLDPRKILAGALVLVFVLTALTWDRNHEWSSEYLLFRTEYDRGYRGYHAVRLIVGALAEDGNHRDIVEICEENPKMQARIARFSNTCALAYRNLGQTDDAIRSFEMTARHKAHWFEANMMIANILIQAGRPQEGADRYVQLINETDDPVVKEIMKGVMFLQLYPGNRQKLLEARGYFEQALFFDPNSEEAKAWIEHVDSMLNPQGKP